MVKKLLFNDVKKCFEQRGYVLLESKYINTKTPLKYMCPKHSDKILEITFDNFQSGKGCKFCGYANSASKKKAPFSEVKHTFEQSGYILLETEYISAKTHLKYLCEKHPNKIRKIVYSQLKSGHGCYDCGIEKIMQKQKTPFDKVKDEFSQRNYILLETEYTNSKTPMTFKCPKHPNKHTIITLEKLRMGSGCYYCGIEASAASKRFSFEEVKKMFAERGYQLLENTYMNSTTKMAFRCPIHPDKNNQITLSNFRQHGQGCYYCGIEASAASKRFSFEEVKRTFAKRGYQLLENAYINNATKMAFRCPIHPDKNTKIRFDHLKKGQGCRYCKYDLLSQKFTGEKGPGWKGGTTNISIFLRDKLDKWKIDALKTHNFKCDITGDTDQIDIHHPVSFSTIRDKTFKLLNLNIKEKVADYSEEELEAIVETFFTLHSQTGIPLKRDLHQEFHKIYGNNVVMEDYIKFKNQYLSKLKKDSTN